MANPKPHTVDQSATQRMEAARAAHQDTKTELLAMVAILSGIWPSHLAPVARPDALFPWVVCLDSPAGRLAYRLTEDDAAAFKHLPRLKVNDRVPCSKSDRLARLLHLASEGW